VAALSQQSFGISPQDLMHNYCRSDTCTDQLPHNIDTEALTLGSISSPENYGVEDHESNTCPSRSSQDQIGPSALVLSEDKQLFYSSERTSGPALDQQKDSLHHIRAELRKRREELAVAEATVSNLQNEIKLLEASANGEGRLSFEDTTKHKHNHKRANDEILRGAKRLKESAISEISRGPNVSGEETLSLTDLHFSTAQDPLPRRSTTAGERGSAHCSFNQYSKIASNCAVTPATSGSGAPDPCLAGAGQNLGQSLPGTSNATSPLVALRAGRSSVIQPLPKETECPEILDESTERLSSDPRPVFLGNGVFNCRACSVEDPEQAIPWVT
jgi:hypothetical protein